MEREKRPISRRTSLALSSNTCFEGLVEYLHGKDGVESVEVRPGRPATAAEISNWEQVSGCVMPEDVKVFYSTHNGIDLQWTYLHQDKTVPLGRIHVASLSELRPLSTTHSHSTSKPSLWDLEPDSGAWQPPLCGDSGSSTMVMDYCPSCGHTCLIFDSQSHKDGTHRSGCSVWLLDLSLTWHQLSHAFSDYLRLAIVHLGLKQWPYAVTPNTLSPEYESWFHIFTPHRLEIGLTTHHPSTDSVQWQSTGTDSVVDISKILQTKPPREKSGRLKSAHKQNSAQATSSRRSSTTKSN